MSEFKNTITHAVIIGAFIASAILTVGLGNDDDSTGETVNSEVSGSPIPSSPMAVEAQASQSDFPSTDNASASGSNASASASNVTITQASEVDPYEELNALIGLESVKKEVTSLANLVKVQKKREERGMKNTSMSYHCVFSGSPGTGKTTVARILARIYKDLGVVSSGHLVETDRSGLIAEYVGQTAVKTNALCDSALNGILFIDEAYALVDDGEQGYGNEAIATLLKRMEDDRDSLVVIVAGYTDEMKKFINANPGLESRFTNYIDFPDYTADELFRIFVARATKYNYRLNAEAEAYLRQSLEKSVKNKPKNFGNARYVRNFFEHAVTVQANRISHLANPTDDDLSIFTLDDLTQAFKVLHQKD